VGAFSRILSLFRGAPWIYACLPGKPTGTAQFHLSELVHSYRIHRFTFTPHVFGIVGDPVAHSYSPAFHNRKFTAAHLPWMFLPFSCNDLGSLMDRALQFGVVGFSVTHPFKEEMLSFLEHPSEEVKRLRSCNTVCHKEDGWHGINTDVAGLNHLIEQYNIG